MKKKLFCKIIFLLLFFVYAEKIYSQTNYKGLVVLIDFSDQPANLPLTRVNNIVNGVGYTEPTVKNSLRDYWYTQSRGKAVVTHDVVGYYRAPQTAAWYNTQTFHEFIELAKQALNWIIATNPGYDWNSLSLASGEMNRNGTEEGTFLSINFITTGWIPGTGGTHWLTGWTAPNGVSTQQITGSTFMAPWDTNVNLFWLTHEQGHLIWGWPDTYDNLGASHGTGKYTVMSGNQGTGDIEPVGAPFLVTEKWVNIIDITTQSIVLTQDGNTVARFRNPSDPLEYFVVEARMRSTIGNAVFPVERGLLIWHVDDNVTTSNIYPQMTPLQHYRISVEQADGLFQLEGHINPGDAGDIYLPGKTFSDHSTPDAKWWDGSNSTLSINNIQLLSNNKISFNATSQFCSVGNSKNQNINVCHNNKTICINQNAVAAHLAHGDDLGPCIAGNTNRQNSTSEDYVKPGINVYPNPNTGNFIATLNLPGDEMKEAIIEVVNISGQLVKKIKPIQQNQTISLKETGFYLIRVITKNQVHEKKVTVIH